MGSKDLIDPYITYLEWAEELFVERLREEPDAVLDTVVESSFPTLRATLLHMRDASCAWYLRMTLQAMRWPAEESTDIGTVLVHGRRLASYLRGLDEEALVEQVEYANLRGVLFRQPRWQLAMHVVNHSTYHRGQLVTMMRRSGLERIPNTDLVRFQRL